MAAMAASLMCRGVGKCGSPAPKSTRLMPWARSLAASAATAMVAETSIRPMRSAKTWGEETAVVIVPSIFTDFGAGAKSSGGNMRNCYWRSGMQRLIYHRPMVAFLLKSRIMGLHMWRWDQGRLAYFQFDALRQISVFVTRYNFKAAQRPALLAETGLAFSAPGTHSPWRNYSRVLKLCLLVSEIGEVAQPTRVAHLMASPGTVTCDEYLHFLARAFTDPSPALDGWNPSVHCRYPLLFTLKYLLFKRAYLQEPVSTLNEIFGAYRQSGFVGDESEADFIKIVGRHNEFEAVGQEAEDDLRQARESLKVITQISYLHLERSNIVLSLDASSALSILKGLRPVQGPRAADRESELSRLAGRFRVETGGGFADYLNVAANDVIQSGFVEGNKIKKTHLVIERNNRLREAYFNSHPSGLCDVCFLDTKATYPWAKRVLDLHHLLPLSSGIQVKKFSTTLDDLVPVCPSCHRAVHRYYDQWLERERLLDFPSEIQARAVYGNLKARFRGAIHV